MNTTKALLSILISFVFLLLAGCAETNRQSREDFVRTYLQKYPEATLQDIYKGSFQDVFGPAHLLTNREAVKNYILKELEHAQTLEGEYYTPCGWQGNFYQVNLSVVQEGKISIDELVDAFMESARDIDTTLTQAWIDEWKFLQQIVRSVSPDLPGFEEDSTLLAHLLNQGKYVVHHSRKFNQHYHPHYRIIRKDLFEEKILPKLKE